MLLYFLHLLKLQTRDGSLKLMVLDTKRYRLS
jgi:hypothetical protein